jgi:glucosyl-dolichyl phosphate glucuronosyltransferase
MDIAVDKTPSGQTPDPEGRLEMSIVIGTFDRCDTLSLALESLAKQTCDPRRFEIIVVDNGSTDGTRDLVAARQSTMRNLRYVVEPAIGLSNARNRGIAEARAGVVGFFDDDGEAEPDWAETVLRMFAEDPELDAMGGRIHPRWAGEQPVWFSRAVEGHYAVCDYGPTRHEIAFPQYPFGPNMAIRRARLLAIGGFRGELGPTGGNIKSCGETDLFYRLHQRPLRVVYEPSAVVHHRIPNSRATRKWLLKRAYRFGHSTSAMQYLNGRHRRLWWVRHAATSVFQVAMAGVATATAAITRSPESVVVSRASFLTYQLGFLRGALTNVLTASEAGKSAVRRDAAAGASEGGSH